MLLELFEKHRAGASGSKRMRRSQNPSEKVDDIYERLQRKPPQPENARPNIIGHNDEKMPRVLRIVF